MPSEKIITPRIVWGGGGGGGGGGELGSHIGLFFRVRLDPTQDFMGMRRDAWNLAGTDSIPPRIVGGIYRIPPENFGGIPCGKFQNLTQNSRLDWWDPTWDWWDFASCFYLGHTGQNVFKQFTVNCICGIDVYFSLSWLYEQKNFMALLLLLKASSLIVN